MKNLLLFSSLLLLIGISLQSCTKDRCEQETSYVQQTPVYLKPSEYRIDIQGEAARDLERPGKIYFYNDFVFINELRKGIHIIDNSNPESPVNTGFIAIPGNVDMAVRGNILYADSYTDLLAIDISSPQQPQLLHREEMVFPPMHENNDGSLLVYYEQELVTEVRDCQNNLVRTDVLFMDDIGRPNTFGNLNAVAESFSGVAADAGGGGVGGSMARFTLSGAYLYTVDDNSMHTFSLQNPSQPQKVNSTQLGWGIETIIPYKDLLFIGSSTGMFIYGLSDPTTPNQLSRFAHINACDPVFVKDDLAYVTLRDGNFCEGFSNQLELLDVSNPSNPVLLETFPMDNPHGLSISPTDELFVCEGEHGLKVFDVTKPRELDKNLLDRQRKIHAYDVIVMPGNRKVVMLIGDDGFYQYDFDNPKKLKLLSVIEVK